MHATRWNMREAAIIGTVNRGHKLKWVGWHVLCVFAAVCGG